MSETGTLWTRDGPTVRSFERKNNFAFVHLQNEETQIPDVSIGEGLPRPIPHNFFNIEMKIRVN